MAVSNIKATFSCPVEKAWNTVTSLEDYFWRSDLDRIESLNDKQFVEYTKEGYATIFTVTAMVPGERWEFDMDNSNMSGHWLGIFSCENGMTTIDFTENVTAKKIFMKPFVKMYLKKQQEAYVNDLRKILEK